MHRIVQLRADARVDCRTQTDRNRPNKFHEGGKSGGLPPLAKSGVERLVGDEEAAGSNPPDLSYRSAGEPENLSQIPNIMLDANIIVQNNAHY